MVKGVQTEEKVLLEAGKQLKKAGNIEAALEKYLAALQLNPDYLPALNEVAELHEQQKQWEKALTYHQEIVKLAPENSLAQAKLARAYQALGQLERAVATYQTALAFNPKLPAWIYKELGEILESQGKINLANTLYQQAINNNTASLYIYKKLGETWRELGRKDEEKKAHIAASKKYCEYLQDNPDNIPALEQLAGVYESNKEFKSAVNCHQHLVKLQPEKAIAHARLARAYGWLQEEEKAVEEYKKAQAITDKLPTWAYLGWADALEKQGELQEAATVWQKVLALAPEQPPITYKKVGELLWQIKQVAQAASCWQKATELYPGNPMFHFRLGQANAAQKQWQAAVEAYQNSIIRQNDYSWEVHHCQGEAQLKLQGWEAAANAFRQAISLDPNAAISHYYLGDVLLELSEWEAAVSCYQRAQNLQPNLLDIEEKIQKATEKQNQKKINTPEEKEEKEIDEQVFPPKEGLGGLNAMEQQARREKALQEFSAVDSLYALWLRENARKQPSIPAMLEAVEQFKYKPVISVIVPVYNPPEKLLREMIYSVYDQIYPYWELCLADDASPKTYVKEVLNEFAAADDRIKVVFRSENGHISAASNSALELATGEYIALLDHDDLLTPDALYHVAKLLNDHPEADMIYSDEDKMNEKGQRLDPYFKPDWCPDSFLARMYVCHLGVYRRAIVKAIAGFRLGYEGSQDYDFVLRFTERTNKIFHIPKILYHWRIHSDSAASGSEAKPYAYEAGKKAIEDALSRRGEKGTVEMNEKVPGVYTVKYQILEHNKKRVSIIIPTRNLGDILDTCIQSIVDKTKYADYEIIIIDNGTDDPKTLKVFEKWEIKKPKRFKVCPLDIPFNYSKLNNFGVKQATGEYLLFLNNDTKVITQGWVRAMVQQAQRPIIGAVGALLLYPDDTVQHAGVVLGIGGVAGHSHKHFRGDSQGYIRQLISVNNYSAVTAACLMCRREVFEDVGGFNENLQVAFNDIDFCLKIKEQGYHNVWLPHVKLYHYESKSRGYEDNPEKQSRFLQEIETMRSRWGQLLELDSCYNPNLSKEREDYSLQVVARVEVLEVKKVPNQPELLWGFSIDRPQVGPHQGLLDIAGWVVGRKSPVASIQVVCHGKVVQEEEIIHLRPDVAGVFPGVAEAEKSGFIVHLDLLKLPEQAELEVVVVLEDSTAVELGKVKLQY
ncbi:MAG: glycosyltransferase [Gomphosphaeria aponina SAG 52.96 = DSM 107014]|uniref:Glycosyltransferase n=1 Tax=Gomphosphaeria aponina SAG 52.96 = DSM 107014 TaxID=1521640 RepID=A0A941GUD3_9CHRO|nr:glycosyltransferase [Gomphosphaeria aponina SAG 52.96 = DSM 107014]